MSKPSPRIPTQEPKKRQSWPVPFRGGILEIWDDTPPDVLAIMAQLNLVDPRIDAFFLAAGTTIQDTQGNTVWPKPKKTRAPKPKKKWARKPKPKKEGNGLIDLMREP